MTRPAYADDRPAGWDETAADLRAEATYLARHLEQPLVRTSGVAGILSRLTPSTVWVYDAVDVDELLDEIDGWSPRPEVMVPDHVEELPAAMEARRWVPTASMDRMRRQLDRPVTAPTQLTSLRVRAATPADLPTLRALHVRAFEAEASADYLPDGMLDVPGLRVLVASLPLRPGRIIGTAGIRLRHEGALIFGLATLPRYQRRGVGSALVVAALSWAADQGAPFAIADVDVPAPRLWPNLGFASTGRWHRYAPA